jgi:hypothetical protein
MAPAVTRAAFDWGIHVVEPEQELFFSARGVLVRAYGLHMRDHGGSADGGGLESGFLRGFFCGLV